MMTDPQFQPGARQELGSHIFTAEAIVAFAKKYDPQPFHIDAEAARTSVFGALCASGWHTAAIWMKLNVKDIVAEAKRAHTENRPAPEFGPSPGIKNVRWFRPVFVGDEIFYSRTVRGVRPLASRPGWWVLESSSDARNRDGKPVMSFESAVLVRFPEAPVT